MVYGLVIVTSLGATALLNVFDNQHDCMAQQAVISKSPISQAQCWPSNSLTELKSSINQINSTVSFAIKKAQ